MWIAFGSPLYLSREVVICKELSLGEVNYTFSSIWSILSTMEYKLCYCTRLYTLFGRLFASYAFKLACNYRRLWSISCPRIIGCDECCFEVWPLTGYREGWKVGIIWKVPFPTFGGAIFCIIGTIWEVTKIRVNMTMVLCVMVKVVSFDATMIAWARTKNLTRKGSVLSKREDRWFEIMAKR